MARSREEVISEMVDSGLFTDDEIRAAVKDVQPKGFLQKAGEFIGAVLPPSPFKQGEPVSLVPPGMTGTQFAGDVVRDLMALPGPINPAGSARRFLKYPMAKSEEGLSMLVNKIPDPQTQSTALNVALGTPKTLAEIATPFVSGMLDPEQAVAGPLLNKGVGALKKLEMGAQKAIAGKAMKMIEGSKGPIGSALDAMVGLERGAGKVALKHPEITKPGFYTMGRVRDFIGRFTKSLNDYEDKIQKAWTNTRDILDKRSGERGQIDRLSVENAIDDTKRALGLGKKEVSFADEPGGSLTETADPFGLEKPTVPRDVMGTPMREIPRAASPSRLPSGEMKVKRLDAKTEVSRAMDEIEGKIASLVEKDPQFGMRAKSKMNLKEATEMRRLIDDKIKYLKNEFGFEDAQFFKLRSTIDDLIATNPAYKNFKKMDAKFQELQKDLSAARKIFNIKSGKTLDDMDPREIIEIEGKIRRTLKKGEAEREAIETLDKRLARGKQFLDEAEQLSAAGGSEPARRKQFEPLVRPGLGYGMLTGAGAAGAATLANPAAGAAALAALGLTAGATSPRLISAGVRGGAALGQKLAQGLSRLDATNLPPQIAALLMRALLSRRKGAQNAVPQ